ncbi:MAG: cob(I)yrinic acid a,c-diamide adenosyltransferase [Treponema sp.]|nr:cob(I)yrinic acid a,c-diamide adenosyltransferase [Treponema sp.]
MKIYTGNGDAGETFDLNGKSVSKNDNIIHFIGTLDELISHLGLIKAMLSNEDAWQFSQKSACIFMEKIQKNLMKIMSAEKISFSDTDVLNMEKEIDRLTANIPECKELVIPGKNIMEAQIHISRTIARKAERLYYTLNEEMAQSPRCPNICAYLNRLSDYLFVLSRQESLINVNFINQITGL